MNPDKHLEICDRFKVQWDAQAAADFRFKPETRRRIKQSLERQLMSDFLNADHGTATCAAPASTPTTAEMFKSMKEIEDRAWFTRFMKPQNPPVLRVRDYIPEFSKDTGERTFWCSTPPTSFPEFKTPKILLLHSNNYPLFKEAFEANGYVFENDKPITKKDPANG